MPCASAAETLFCAKLPNVPSRGFLGLPVECSERSFQRLARRCCSTRICPTLLKPCRKVFRSIFILEKVSAWSIMSKPPRRCLYPERIEREDFSSSKTLWTLFAVLLAKNIQYVGVTLARTKDITAAETKSKLLWSAVCSSKHTLQNPKPMQHICSIFWGGIKTLLQCIALFHVAVLLHLFFP